jgi:ubiquinone/menaquinone biosynthesis C-methylase UbiE
MTIRQHLVSQFGSPRGALGHLAGWVMAHRRSNVQRNQWAVEVLDLAPTDRVLEIGFGPGVAIEALARAVPAGHVYGVDQSQLMVEEATKRNAAAVKSGRVALVHGSVDALPAYDAPLDAILAVNSMGFSPDPPARLKELDGLLAPGGKLAIVTQPRNKGATDATAHAAALDAQRMLGDAGLMRVRVETLELEPPAVCVIGFSAPA